MSALPIKCKNYFRHCRFFFWRYSGRMDFHKEVSKYSAQQIMAAIGCPRGTAYDWLSKRREPPKWQQPHWLRILKENAPEKRDRRRKVHE